MKHFTLLLLALSVSLLVLLMFFGVVTSSHRLSTIKIDGSSTAYPISEAVAEEFRYNDASISVTVGVSGTGGGFKKFLAREIDIVDASRPIRAAELELAKKNGVEFIEIPIAYDALSVVVNKKNSWVEYLTVQELASIWSPEAQGKVMKWSDVRAGFPNKPLKLFGAGTDSGTFDYFTEVIVGREDASRGDYTSSEDDNVIVTGVAGDEGALGYFGFGYYEGNVSRLKIVPIDDGAGAILPSRETVENGAYRPLTRPLFVYINRESLERPEVKKFISFYIQEAPKLVSEVGFIALPASAYTMAKERVDKLITGSIYAGSSVKQGLPIEQSVASESISEKSKQ